jgi:transposase
MAALRGILRRRKEERMAPQQKERLRALTAEEQATLARVRQATSGRHDEVRRATALLAVAAGASFVAAARGAGYASGSTVHALVKRFNARGLAALAIAPGRGPKVLDAATTRAPVVALAQRPPDRKVDGTATWSLSTLERAVRREIFPAPKARTSAQILRDAGSSYQKTRTWCPTGTAERKRKDGVVRVVDPETEQNRGASTQRTA